MSITSSILPTFALDCKESPHCLLHLTTSEWRRCKANSIYVSGLFKSHITSFDNVVMGCNVVAPLKKSTSHGMSVVWKELNLSETKGGYVIITTSTNDLSDLIENHNLILIDGMNGCQDTQVKSTKSKMSGYVLLAVMHLDKTLEKKGFKWGRKQYDIVKSCKKNIITLCNNHNGSCGEYFSWGNKGNYGMEHKSSVGSYVTRPGVKSSLNSAFIEQMINTELQSSILKVGKILPSLPKVIAPVIGVAHQIQLNTNDINITERYGSNVGIWQSSVGINAVTKEMHTEDDVTYTTISVPRQEFVSTDRHYHFMFQFGQKYNVSLPLTGGTTLLFSGKFLTHRQTCNVHETTNDELFINFASYGCKRLYSHIRQSFIRNTVFIKNN